MGSVGEGYRLWGRGSRCGLGLTNRTIVGRREYRLLPHLRREDGIQALKFHCF